MADDLLPQRRTCGTMELHHRLLDTSPPYVEARDRIEDEAYRVEHGARLVDTGECTEIPVVVHVVWNAEEFNVSREQIDSQIDVLNQDFRKLNTDVATVPDAFASLAADARIRFVLADTDPDGAPTDGVVRVQSSSADFDSSDEIKSDATGGSSPWPSDRYLNLWVGRLRGGLLGYAQFPGGPAETDGVVVTTTAFGTMGTATAPFNRGRTTTHEIGHWLNLRHIWGDDGDGCSGSDFVADTPNQGGPNYGTPAFPTVSCGNAPNGDMFMNYLDYVDDAAMSMFTTGQVVRMHAALTGPRAGLGRTVACEPAAADDETASTTTEPAARTTAAAVAPAASGSVLEPPAAFEPPAAPESTASSTEPVDPRLEAMAVYPSVLSHYAQLYQRGLLDAEGYAAWKLAWQAFRALGQDEDLSP